MKFNPLSRIKASTCSLLLTFILFFIPVSLMALSSDRSQPIDLEADSADIDDLKGISIYTGNVILTQGSMVIKSSKLTLYTNKDKELEKAILELGIKVLEIPREALFLTGKTFLKYRKNKGTKSSPLPDFFIGAHVSVESFDLITRDTNKYTTYFPQVKLIHPEH